MAGKFVYQERTAEQVDKRANQQGGLYDSYIHPKFTTASYKSGDVAGRIMPPTWGTPDLPADHYGIELWVHSSVGADDQSYLCKQRMKDEPCLICEEIALAKRSGDEIYAGNLAAYKRVLVWWVDRKKMEDGPKPYVMPWSLDRDIAGGSKDKLNGGILLIDHPTKGYDVFFTITGEGQKKKYISVQIARQSTPLNDDPKEQDRWLEFIAENPLPSILHYYPDEHISKVLLGKKVPAGEQGAGASAPVTRSEAKPQVQAPPKEEDHEPPTARPRTIAAPTRPTITDASQDLDGPSTSTAKPVTPAGEPIKIEEKQFWAMVDGKPTKVLESAVYQTIKGGVDPSEMDLMLVGDTTWKKAKDFGFVKPAAPTPPPPPPKSDDTPPPPPKAPAATLQPLPPRPRPIAEDESVIPPGGGGTSKVPTRPKATVVDTDD